MSNAISAISGTIKNWWVFLIIGILLLVASYYMFSTPVESFVGLAGLFSALIFVSGLLGVFFALTNKDEIDNFRPYLAGWVFDGIVRFILLKYSAITLLVLSLNVGSQHK